MQEVRKHALVLRLRWLAFDPVVAAVAAVLVAKPQVPKDLPLPREPPSLAAAIARPASPQGHAMGASQVVLQQSPAMADTVPLPPSPRCASPSSLHLRPASSAVSAFAAGAIASNVVARMPDPVDLQSPEAVADAAVAAAVAKVVAARRKMPGSPSLNSQRPTTAERQQLLARPASASTAAIAPAPAKAGAATWQAQPAADMSMQRSGSATLQTQARLPGSPTAMSSTRQAPAGGTLSPTRQHGGMPRADSLDPRDAARRRRESLVASRASDLPEPVRPPPAAEPSRLAPARPAEEAGSAEDSGDWTSWAIDSLAAAVSGGFFAAAAEGGARGGDGARLSTPPRTRQPPPLSPGSAASQVPPSPRSSPGGWMSALLGTSGEEEIEDGSQLRRGRREPEADDDDAPRPSNAAAHGAAAWHPWRSCAAAPGMALRDDD
jgi:hypothetical protein